MGDFTEFGNAELKGWSEPETAKAYADGFAFAAEQCVPDMVRCSGASSASTALDICCGQGIVAEGLAKAGTAVTGLDFSPAMLEMARARVADVSFVEGDAMALPFADNSYDVATMGFGILHVPDTDAALREAHRILKPGGTFTYSVWHAPDISAAFRIVFSSIEQHGSKEISLPPGPPLHAFADPDFAFPALEAVGFTEPKLETCNSYWEFDHPGRPYDYFYEGTVRGALLLRSQPEENAKAIRNAIENLVMNEFGYSGPWRVPIPAAIVTAIK
ncbi:MAG: methyltransferase domain-containing protein [Pseudomonadota bacterium]